MAFILPKSTTSTSTSASQPIRPARCLCGSADEPTPCPACGYDRRQQFASHAEQWAHILQCYRQRNEQAIRESRGPRPVYTQDMMELDTDWRLVQLDEAGRAHYLASYGKRPDSDAEALARFGHRFLLGIDTCRDPALGVWLLETATRRGDGKARHWLGEYLLTACTAQRNPVRAASLLNGSPLAELVDVISALLTPCAATPHDAAELRHRAKLGEVQGMADYGVCLCQGHGLPQRIQRGVAYLTQALQAGSGRALMLIGLAQWLGLWDFKQEAPERCLQKIATGAEWGDAMAQLLYGLCLANGIVVDADPATARQLFQKAAQQDLAQAHTAQGLMYLNNRAAMVPREQAIKHLQQAVLLGDARACAVLGRACLEGSLQPKDAAAAFNLYQRGAKTGDPVCKLALARLLQQGHGCRKSPELAAAIIEQLATQGDAHAQLLWSQTLRQSNKSAAELAEAAHWLAEAATNGERAALSELGHQRLAAGETDAAIDLLKGAGQLADQAAVTTLAQLFSQKNSATQDFQQYQYWRKKQAAHGDLDALREVAQAYALNYPQLDDLDECRREAAHWMGHFGKRATKQDYFFLGQLYIAENSCVYNPVHAFEHFKIAAAHGSKESFLPLGHMYRDGIGTRKNRELSEQMLRKAYKLGYKDALPLLPPLTRLRVRLFG